MNCQRAEARGAYQRGEGHHVGTMVAALPVEAPPTAINTTPATIAAVRLLGRAAMAAIASPDPG